MPHLKALIIRSPYIELILAGKKTWEMRSRRNHWRGPVALIQKDSLHVSGVIDLTAVIGRMSDDERLASQSKHCVLPHVWLQPRMAKYNIGWVLSNPVIPCSLPPRYPTSTSTARKVGLCSTSQRRSGFARTLSRDVDARSAATVDGLFC